jgi:hypothetical protein
MSKESKPANIFPVSPAAGLLGLTTIAGSALAEPTGGKGKNKYTRLLDLIRGGMKGLATGTGAIGGYGVGGALSGSTDSSVTPGKALGAILGALGSNYLANKLSVLAGLEEEPSALKYAAKSETLKSLITAKELSDKKQYIRKNIILRALVSAAPDEFDISDEPKNGIVGLTHKPTNFRIHMLQSHMPSAFYSRN